MTDKNTNNFNIYYLNFSKVYEISMMINNVILSSIQKDNIKNFETQYGYTSSLSAKGSKRFLDGIKATISSEAKEKTFSSSKIIETLDVKTTKSILLRRVIERCDNPSTLTSCKEGNLIKIDNVKLDILDEKILRQFLILRKDALKGYRVEGMEVNNLISSVLQDYSYILKGTIINNSPENTSSSSEVIIKIPLEIQNEFENKYNIDDLLIGHVSLVGVYKGLVEEEFITSNTYTYLQNVSIIQGSTDSQVLKSNTAASLPQEGGNPNSKKKYHYIDIIAIIQDVSFHKIETPIQKIHWWSRLKNWFLKPWR